MTVKWTYNGNTLRRRRSTSTNVSVVIHYQKHGGADNRYPPEGTLAAEEKQVTIEGHFDSEAKYKVWLTVYEGLLAVSFLQTQPVEAIIEKDLSNGTPVVVIAASAAAAVVILIIVSLIGILLYRRHAKNKDCNDVASKPGSMLMVHREHEMVDGYSNVACDDDNESGVAYAQVNKKKKVEGNEAKETDDDDAVVYTNVVGTKAAHGNNVQKANKAKKKQKTEEKKGDPEDEDDDDNVVYSDVTTKPKQGANKAKENKRSEDKKAEEPEDDEDGDVVYSEVTVKPRQDGDVYVNVSAGSVENDNLYMNVEKSANSETQKPAENVGPDGTIYADLSFARSAPAAVKQHEDGDDDDDDKVVYAAIDFAKNTPAMEKK
ncbi:hypothetical protein LSAT2_012663 [Lamellibrachia satsuma]|nr:hypothetical protein LSAT2_012663 [Lamellibrachia satsuma]